MGKSKYPLPRSILLVGESAPSICNLRSRLFDVCTEVNLAEENSDAFQMLDQSNVDLVVVWPQAQPDRTISFLEKMRISRPDVPVVVALEKPDIRQAIQFVRAGAVDYIENPPDPDHILRLMDDNSSKRGKMLVDRGKFFSPNCPPTVPIVGKSKGIARALETLKVVAQSHCNPILIMGQTGTGKELAAKTIHAWRCGLSEKLVAVNCAALSASLLESELFGHVKGAFTGAERDKTGLFELAGGGTIFLDEISEMPLPLQAKLLRVLQEKNFRKVGGTKDIACGATIVASSNRDLLAESKAGKFRKDLYYRLAVFPITLPSLNSESRREDIPLLAQYFVESSAKPLSAITERAKEILLNHNWPGNVRELRNVIERAIIIEQEQEITPRSIIIESDGYQQDMELKGDNGGDFSKTSGKKSEIHEEKPEPAKRVDFSLEAAEREFILRALKETGWQRTRAAALLGITRATLHAKIKRYHISDPEKEMSDYKQDKIPLKASA